MRGNKASGSGVESIALGLAGYIRQEQKVIDTGEGKGVSDRGLAMAAELNDALRSAVNGEDGERDAAIRRFRDAYEDSLGTPMTIEALNQAVEADPTNLQNVQALYDVKDAVALVMIANAGVYPTEMYDLLDNEDGSGVEEVVGVPQNHILNGIGEEMINFALVDERVVDALQNLQTSLRAGDDFRGVEDAIRTVDKLKSEDARAVSAYLHAIRAGMSPRRGGPMMRQAGQAFADAGMATGLPGSEIGGNAEYVSPYEMRYSTMVGLVQDMDQIPWRADNPPEWYENASPERRLWLYVSRKVADGAAWGNYWRNGDLEKMWRNPQFYLNGKEMNALMNDDFKLVSKWILQELCNFERTEDGRWRLRYKADPSMTGEQAGGGMHPDVKYKLNNIDEFEDGLALRLVRVKAYGMPDMGGLSEGDPGYYKALDAKLADMDAERGVRRDTVGLDDRLNAYNAWNFWFMTYGSTLADVNRVLAPDSKIAGDKIRTLNAESKAIKKLKIFDKNSREVIADSNETAEYFGGPMSAYIEAVIALENATGKAVDWQTGKTLKQKVIDGDFWLFNSPLQYSFYDIMEVKAGGSPETVARALYEGHEFSWPDDQTDQLFLFRDTTEAAVRIWTVMMGKAGSTAKSFEGLTIELQSAVGLMASLNNKQKERLSGVSRRGEMWAACMVNTFGARTDVVGPGIFIRGDYAGDLQYQNEMRRLYNLLQVGEFVNPDVFLGYLGARNRTDITKSKGNMLMRGLSLDRYYKQKWAAVNREAERREQELIRERGGEPEENRLARWLFNAIKAGDEVVANMLQDMLDEYKQQGRNPTWVPTEA